MLRRLFKQAFLFQRHMLLLLPVLHDAPAINQRIGEQLDAPAVLLRAQRYLSKIKQTLISIFKRAHQQEKEAWVQICRRNTGFCYGFLRIFQVRRCCPTLGGTAGSGAQPQGRHNREQLAQITI